MSSHLEDPAGNVDRLLVERCRAGDADAFGDLYRRHYARLYRFVRARVSQACVAEDVTQEAFARAMVALQGLRNPNRFYPWLTVIARHLVANHHRSTAMVRHVSDLDAPSTADAPDAEILRLEEHQDVRAALERVRRRHREILTMRERDELSYEDMARLLGTPSTTIPPLLWRARAAFRREYLAVTGEEPKLVGIPLLLDAIRRFRARLAQYGMWLPDAHALCASAMCAALTLGGIAATLPGDAGTSGPTWRIAMGVGMPVRAQIGRSASEMVTDGNSDAFGHPPTSGVGRDQPDLVVPGVAHAGLNNPARAQRTRDEARRNMPIFHEFGPIGFAADPGRMQRDVEGMLPINN